VGEIGRMSPCIDWSCPVTVLFDRDVVYTSADAEEAVLSPVSAPRITYSPEWLTILFAVAHDANNVYDVLISSLVAVDATSVVFETLGDCDVAGNGSPLINFVHYCLLTVSKAELLNLVCGVLRGDKAGLAWATITAVAHWRALWTVGPATALVN